MNSDPQPSFNKCYYSPKLIRLIFKIPLSYSANYFIHNPPTPSAPSTTKYPGIGFLTNYLKILQKYSTKKL
jgi:hypothetical protein